MRTVLLSPGANPIAVNKYIISYQIRKNALLITGCVLSLVESYEAGNTVR